MLRWCSRSIFLQVVLGLVLGIVCGLTLPEYSAQLKPLGDGFIKLIKMLIGLIVFCVVVSGISGAGDLKKVGRIGLKSVIYFEILTTIALVIGLVFAFSTGIGSGANIHLDQLSTADIGDIAQRGQHMHTTTQFLMDLIPTSVIGAFADNNILQVLLFSVLFGSALNLVGEAASGISRLINELSHVIFRIMGMIVRLAPIGVFGAIAFTTSKYGLDSLQHLGSLVGLFYLTCVAFVSLILGLVMRLSGLRMWPLLKYLREELLIVMGTASSDAVLPQIMRKLEHLGIGSSTVGLVIPTGYSFNLDGFSIYLTLAIVFIANATGTPLAMTDLLTILLVADHLQRCPRDSRLGAGDSGGDPDGDPGNSSSWPGAGGGGGLVHGDRPGADQPDRQLRRHRGHRPLGEGHRYPASEQGTFRSGGLYLPAEKTGGPGASAGILNNRRACPRAGTAINRFGCSWSEQ
jgi:aerobic C4-dicarboxylate transport protein